MGTNGEITLDTRVVAVRVPDGDTEYWLTDAEFELGDTVWCKGRRWVVAKLLSARETGTHVRLHLREPDAESVSASNVSLAR